MKITFLKILVMLVVTFIFYGCQDTTSDPDGDTNDITGEVMFVFPTMTDNGVENFYYRPANNIKMILLENARAIQNINSYKSNFRFRDVNPGTYSIKAIINDTIFSISELFEMLNGDYSLQDTIALPYNNDKFDLEAHTNWNGDSAWVRYSLEADSDISIEVIDSRGKFIINLISEESYQKGNHSELFSFDKRLDHGTYYLILKTKDDYGYCNFLVR